MTTIKKRPNRESKTPKTSKEVTEKMDSNLLYKSSLPVGATFSNDTKLGASRGFRQWLFSMVACWVLLLPAQLMAQGGTKVSALTDARQITVGDQVRLFLQATHDTAAGRLQWTVVPDTFNTLEVVERGKIDTTMQGGVVTYKQRLLITGFDSGLFKIPAFGFVVIPPVDTPYFVSSDSLELLVQTVAVDTTKEFKGIKDIIKVESTWRDYLPQIIGGVVAAILIVLLTIYLVKRQKNKPPVPELPDETFHERAVRLLGELEIKELWQKDQVKAYYVELTDIIRNYIEDRFKVPVLELTTDEILLQVKKHRELNRYYNMLDVILHTADLAKFAKAQPLPEEHIDALEQAKLFVAKTKPVIIVDTPQQPGQTKQGKGQYKNQTSQKKPGSAGHKTGKPKQ